MVKTRASLILDKPRARFSLLTKRCMLTALVCHRRQVVGNQPKVALMLLRAGANPVLLLAGGLRLAPLFIAASTNDPGLLKAMHRGGANLTAIGGDGFTVVRCSCL